MRAWMIGAVTALMAVTAGPAAAAVTTITYRGVVASGTDVTGEFGAAGADLTGRQFVAVFTTDDQTPGAVDTQNATSSSIEGNAPPPVTGRITITGVTQVFDGDYGAQFQSDDGTFEFFEHFASNHASAFDFGTLFAGGFGSGLDFLPGADWRTLSGADLSGVPNLFGSLNISASDPDTDAVLRRAFADLRITSVGVPEPQAWALMILGFGAVGALSRMRRGRAA